MQTQFQALTMCHTDTDTCAHKHTHTHTRSRHAVTALLKSVYQYETLKVV